MTSNKPLVKKLGLATTSAFVIANMIGTGVFGSLGFQLADNSNVIAVLCLWLIGGVIALSGALVYSELGAAMPRSGGEYHYLSKIYQPWVGFLSGWISITVGFAAPVAASAMLLGGYLSRITPVNSEMIAISVVIVLTLIHMIGVGVGGRFQSVFTLFKILLILVFIVCGFVIPTHHENLAGAFDTLSYKDFFNTGFFSSMIYVTYAFSGWNASAYIAGEIHDPQRNIPRSIPISTLLVTVPYFLLNFVFLWTAPVSELVGQKEVGYISAKHIFGPEGGSLMAGFISILLVSTISSMVFVGPRVSQVMGEDMKIFRFLAKKSNSGTPVGALLFQMVISIFLITTASFESVMNYTGFTLNLFTILTVMGIFVHRHRFKDAERPYKTWGYPFVPILYLVIISLVGINQFIRYPYESLYGLGTVFSGLIIYWINIYIEKKKNIIHKTN